MGSGGVHLMLTILDAAVGHPIPRRYSQPRPRAGRRKSSPNPRTDHPRIKGPGVVVGVCTLLRKALLNRCQCGQNWDPERRGCSSSPLLALGAMRRSRVQKRDAVGRIGRIKDRAPRWTSDELPRAELEHHGIF